MERAADAPADAIHRLAGLQAQYANSPYIALWSRLGDFEIEALEKALDDRSVVKASAIRNTLHLVAAEDYPPFMEVAPAARVAKAARSALTDEAERLVRFIVRDAGRTEVRWVHWLTG